jgi:uncharacterized Zn-binding protein involved in type VI secretion
MSAITRLGDLTTGHGCFPPMPSITASTNVFCNGIGVVRVSDVYTGHCCGPACHGGVLAAGSSTVFVNGRALGRIGDLVSCGDHVGQGSSNSFCG